MSLENNQNEIEERESEDKEEFIKETEKLFETVQKELKNDARQMFISGSLLYKEYVDEEMSNSMRYIKEHPEETRKMLKDAESHENEEVTNKNSLFEEGCFAQTPGNDDLKDKMHTFHKKHDEDMNFNCRKCGNKISAHNKDWHDSMCDKCFNEKILNK